MKNKRHIPLSADFQMRQAFEHMWDAIDQVSGVTSNAPAVKQPLVGGGSSGGFGGGGTSAGGSVTVPLHIHPISDISGLSAALALKLESVSTDATLSGAGTTLSQLGVVYAPEIETTDDNTTVVMVYPIWTTADGVAPPKVSKTTFQFNPLSGQIIAGQFKSKETSGAAHFVADAPAGVPLIVAGSRGGINRWIQMLGSSEAEAGADAGSAYRLVACKDDGTYIDDVMKVLRAAGSPVTFNRPVTISTGNLVISNGNLVMTNGVLDLSTSISINTAPAVASFSFKSPTKVLRWSWFTYNTETGTGDAGSDLLLRAYSDTGVTISNLVLFGRAANSPITFYRKLVSSNGINFGQNDLTNYTEGTFTPTLIAGWTNTGTPYIAGYYRRIGKWIRCVIVIGGSSAGGTGTISFASGATVGSLPFTPASITNGGYSCGSASDSNTGANVASLYIPATTVVLSGTGPASAYAYCLMFDYFI